MLERFRKLVDNAIKKQGKNNLMEWPLEDVQGLFEMKHVNDWLKYNAMNENQIRNTINCEIHLNEIIKNLYVPSYQQENV